jgi:hypothetical protein
MAKLVLLFVLLIGNLCTAQSPKPLTCPRHLSTELASYPDSIWPLGVTPVHFDLSRALPKTSVVALHRRLLTAFSNDSKPPVSVRVNYIYQGAFRDFRDFPGDEQRAILAESGATVRALLNELVFPELNVMRYQGHSDWSEAFVVGASLRVLSSSFPLNPNPAWHTDGGVSIVSFTGLGRGTPLFQRGDVPEGHLVVLAPELTHSIVFGTPHDRWMVQAFLSREMHDNPAYARELVIEHE